MGYPIDRFGGRGVLGTRSYFHIAERNTFNCLNFVLDGLYVLWLVSIGALISVPAYAILAFTSVSPYVSVVFLGLGFALVPDAIWPALALVSVTTHTTAVLSIHVTYL